MIIELELDPRIQEMKGNEVLRFIQLEEGMVVTQYIAPEDPDALRDHMTKLAVAFIHALSGRISTDLNTDRDVERHRLIKELEDARYDDRVPPQLS